MRRGAERRRFVRVSDEVVVSITRCGDPEASDGRTLNFSAGGVLLALPEPLPVGCDIDVVLRLEDDRLLPLQARVIRVRTMSDHNHEVACELLGGSVGEHRALQQLIIERVRTPAPRAPQSA